HDIAEGGLAVAIAESCLAGSIGAEVELGEDLLDGRAPSVARSATAALGLPRLPSAVLYGEGCGCFIVSGAGEALRELGARAPTRLIGTVGGEALTIAIADATVSATLAELTRAHRALGALFA